MEKVRAELAIFFVEKVHALHLTSFLLSVLLLTIATSQSARGNLDSYCKKYIKQQEQEKKNYLSYCEMLSQGI